MDATDFRFTFPRICSALTRHHQPLHGSHFAPDCLHAIPHCNTKFILRNQHGSSVHHSRMLIGPVSPPPRIIMHVIIIIIIITILHHHTASNRRPPPRCLVQQRPGGAFKPLKIQPNSPYISSSCPTTQISCRNTRGAINCCSIINSSHTPPCPFRYIEYCSALSRITHQFQGMLHLPQAPNAPAAADIAQGGVFRNDFSIITKANSVLKGRRVGTGNSGSTRGNESQRV